ncbi:hypothetical protein GJV07_23140 [Enterobacteriaceae bacterium RIT711]|nr:hypothetical protein [Enterobacteriaceae bacterium RIT711]
MTTPKHAADRAPQPRTIYFTTKAAEITYQQVKNALLEISDKYPAATKYSFKYNHKRDHGKPIDVFDNDERGETFINSVRECADWLIHCGFIETQRKTPDFRRTAYGHKHAVERWIRNVKNAGCGGDNIPYVPSMAFCVAAWILEIPEHWKPGYEPSYPLSVRTLNRADYLQRLALSRNEAANDDQYLWSANNG